MTGGPKEADVVVLGAGMVGVSAALHLQKRGRATVLLDRRGVAEETSHGNAGIIQREGIVPYMFPREWATVFKYALNRSSEAHYHLAALPRIAPWMFRYWRASTPEGKHATARAMVPIVTRCIDEHEMLMNEAGVAGMLRRTGYIKAFRDPALLEAAIKADEADRATYGVNAKPLTGGELAELEPHLRPRFAGTIHMPDPATISDPTALARAYADLFVKLGGRVMEGEARSLEQDGARWRVATRDGWLSARDVVVALGPWSTDVTRRFGLKIPLGVKRGYHMHYRADGNATLNRPVIDTAYGYVLAPMTKGIRLTTGAEFAMRDADATPVQLGRVEPVARDLFPLAERVDPAPWLGRRPCLPDMLPVVGPAPGQRGLWLDFGHHHLGFTLGPVTGRLLAEMMTGEAPFTDPAPYRADRF